MTERKMKKEVRVGNLILGGNNPVRVQSMLNVPASDIQGSISQAKRLCDCGCEIIRAAVPTLNDANLIYELKKNISVPVVADIHFDYRIALECVAAGVDKIRINPGNIGDDENVRNVAKACATAGIPIRIGVNSGSVEKHILEKYQSPVPQALCESALYHVALLNKYDFDNIVISIKSSDVSTMTESYRLISERTLYPLHLGVTEAGTKHMGIIKSAVGIGSLLLDGIGDTIRVSLTDKPEEEVDAAYDILRAAKIRQKGANLISCPTCGRTQIDLCALAKQVDNALKKIDKPLTVAVMGCVVNGPGEAKEADIGVAGGKDCGVIFRHGKIIKTVPENNLFTELMKEIDNL